MTPKLVFRLIVAVTAGCVTPQPTPSPPVTQNPASWNGIFSGPRAEVCANRAILDVAPPTKSVRIGVNDDPVSIMASRSAGTMFVFSTGVHRVFVLPIETGDTLTGEPGAVLDGQWSTSSLATSRADNVTITGLTIRRFGTPDGAGSVNRAAVNRETGDGWKVTRSTFELNDGAALNLGSNSVTKWNCFDRNGQYGVAVPGRNDQISNVTLVGNEIASNNRGDLDGHGCSGCTGGMKFWKTRGALIEGNWVHHNNGVGVWIDNNNTDVVVNGNWINNNTKEGIMYETSYNGRITWNTLVANTIVSGSARTDMFPKAAIFVSSSGGNMSTSGAPEVLVADNTLDGNWNGITVFSDGNRFCGSVTDTSVGHCTLRPGASQQKCIEIAKSGNAAAFWDTCYWVTRNVNVQRNTIRFTSQDLTNCGGRCGRGVSVEATKTSADARFRSPAVTVTNPLSAYLIRDITRSEVHQTSNQIITK